MTKQELNELKKKANEGEIIVCKHLSEMIEANKTMEKADMNYRISRMKYEESFIKYSIDRIEFLAAENKFNMGE